MDPSFQFVLGVSNLVTGLNPPYGTGEIKALLSAARAFRPHGKPGCCRTLPSPFLTRITNSLFAVESDLRNGWSATHRKTIKLARQGMTQVEMAKVLGITQAAVSQRLKHARWDRYQQICAMLWELLSHVRWRTLLPWDLKQTLRKPE